MKNISNCVATFLRFIIIMNDMKHFHEYQTHVLKFEIAYNLINAQFSDDLKHCTLLFFKPYSRTLNHSWNFFT